MRRCRTAFPVSRRAAKRRGLPREPLAEGVELSFVHARGGGFGGGRVKRGQREGRQPHELLPLFHKPRPSGLGERAELPELLCQRKRLRVAERYPAAPLERFDEILPGGMRALGDPGPLLGGDRDKRPFVGVGGVSKFVPAERVAVFLSRLVGAGPFPHVRSADRAFRPFDGAADADLLFDARVDLEDEIGVLVAPNHVGPRA